jgi:hypothetical protein
MHASNANVTVHSPTGKAGGKRRAWRQRMGGLTFCWRIEGNPSVLATSSTPEASIPACVPA